MSNPDPEKLLTMSRLMARLCLVAIVFIPLGHLAIWFGLVEVRDVMGAAGVTALINAPETTASTRLGGFACKNGTKRGCRKRSGATSRSDSSPFSMAA